MARAELNEPEEGHHLHYVSRLAGRDDVHVICTFDEPAELPAGAKILVQSRPFAGVIPPNAAVWYTL